MTPLYGRREPMERVEVWLDGLVHWQHKYSSQTACQINTSNLVWYYTECVATCLSCIARVDQ